MNQKEQERIRRNAAALARIEELYLRDLEAYMQTGESMITDTSRGHIGKMLQQNGFNADLTTIPVERKVETGLTAVELAESEEDSWL